MGSEFAGAFSNEINNARFLNSGESRRERTLGSATLSWVRRINNGSGVAFNFKFLDETTVR